MMNELLRVMARLRDPETGCPWDRAQDSRSLIPYLLEESYEVVEVLEQKALDPAALRDELGDLLFQVVFHSRVAEEQAWFDFSAVAAGITEKLVRRHPHVFEDTGLGHDPARWDAIKASERQAAGKAAGVLADVPVALPALARADKLGRRAARFGFDWRAAGDVLAKVREELAEVDDALAAGESAGAGGRGTGGCAVCRGPAGPLPGSGCGNGAAPGQCQIREALHLGGAAVGR